MRRLREAGFTAIFVHPSCRGDCGSIKIQRPLAVLLRGRAWPFSEDLTMAEAMAIGTPVVAARVGSVPEAAVDGYERAYGALLTPAPIGVRATEMPETPSNP